MDKNKNNITWFQKIFNIFKKKPVEPEKPVEPKKVEVVDERQEKLNYINNSITSFFINTSIDFDIDEKTLAKDLNNAIDKSTKEYENLGHFDGQHNSKDFNIDLKTKSHATYIQEFVYSKLKGLTDGLKEAIELKKEQKNRIYQKLDLNDKFHNEMLKYANNNTKEFSIPRKWMYLIFGFILLFSDLPLSLNIVETLRITEEPILNLNNEKTIDDKAAKPPVQSIFEITLGWIDKNWESILFAFGIAFSTILIKILYDEYIYTKLGKWSRDLNEFNDKERRNVIIERYIKLTVNILILLGLLIMLLNLGKIRNETVIQQLLFDKAQNTRNTNPTLSDEELRLSGIRFWSFVLITIVIPTISGICLSIGFTIADNLRMFKRSIEQLKVHEIEFENIAKECTELVMKHSNLVVFLDKWAKIDDKVKNLATRFSASYNQGVKRGFLIVHGYDFYALVEAFHGEVTENKLQKMINKP